LITYCAAAASASASANQKSQSGHSVEELPLGTAGSVRLASEKLDDTFLVISGDALCDVDLGALVDRHKESGAAVTIGLKSVDNPLEFGIVVTDDDGKVERFLEKPSWGQVFSDTINTGIYVLSPEVLRHVPRDRPYDFRKLSESFWISLDRCSRHLGDSDRSGLVLVRLKRYCFVPVSTGWNCPDRFFPCCPDRFLTCRTGSCLC
jgi:hypothetical protein